MRSAGDPANALIVAREHRERLSKDLGVDPTVEVEELAESIRAGSRGGREKERDTAPVPDAVGDRDAQAGDGIVVILLREQDQVRVRGAELGVIVEPVEAMPELEVAAVDQAYAIIIE